MKKIIPITLLLFLLVSCKPKPVDTFSPLPTFVITYPTDLAEQEEIVDTTYGPVSISVSTKPLNLINTDIAMSVHNSLNAKIADIVTVPEKYGVRFDNSSEILVGVFESSIMNNIASYRIDIRVHTNAETHEDYTVFDTKTWSVGVNYDLNTGNELSLSDICVNYETPIAQHIAFLNATREEHLQGLLPARGFYLSPKGLDILEAGVDPLPFNIFENITLNKYVGEILWADGTEVEYILLETPLKTEHNLQDYRTGLHVQTIKLIDEGVAGDVVNSFLPKEFPEDNYSFNMTVCKFGNYIAYNATEYRNEEGTTTQHLLDASTGQDVPLSSLFVEGFDFMPIIQNEALLFSGEDISLEKIQFTISARLLYVTIPSIPNYGSFSIPFSEFGFENLTLFQNIQ